MTDQSPHSQAPLQPGYSVNGRLIKDMDDTELAAACAGVGDQSQLAFTRFQAALNQLQAQVAVQNVLAYEVQRRASSLAIADLGQMKRLVAVR